MFAEIIFFQIIILSRYSQTASAESDVIMNLLRINAFEYHFVIKAKKYPEAP